MSLPPIFRAVIAALLLSAPFFTAERALAQPDVEALEEERAGSARGGSYAWGESSTDVPAAAPAPPAHRYARIFGTVGAGGTVRILQYEALGQSRFAPVYLQLRAGYFFDGDGDVQHGIGLGISTNLAADGQVDTAGLILGIDPLTTWTFTPQYLLRIWFGDWVQLVGRVGVSATASTLPNLGFEVGIGPVIKFLSGFGIYADVSFSGYFANDFHPLVSLEGGLVFDYEILP